MLREIEIMSKKEAHALKIHRGFIGVSYIALCAGKRVYQENDAPTRKGGKSVRVVPANGRGDEGLVALGVRLLPTARGW